MKAQVAFIFVFVFGIAFALFVAFVKFMAYWHLAFGHYS